MRQKERHFIESSDSLKSCSNRQYKTLSYSYCAKHVRYSEMMLMNEHVDVSICNMNCIGLRC